VYAAYGRVDAAERFAQIIADKRGVPITWSHPEEGSGVAQPRRAAPAPAEDFVKLTLPQIEATLIALNAASVEYPTEAAREAYDALRAVYRQLTGTDWSR
jgi:hypothetical protein